MTHLQDGRCDTEAVSHLAAVPQQTRPAQALPSGQQGLIRRLLGGFARLAKSGRAAGPIHAGWSGPDGCADVDAEGRLVVTTPVGLDANRVIKLAARRPPSSTLDQAKEKPRRALSLAPSPKGGQHG